MRPHRRQPTRLPSRCDSPGKNTGVGCHFLLQCTKVKVKVKSLSRVRLLAIHGLKAAGSSVHGIFQARVLEWGTIAFSTSLESPALADRFLTSSTTWEALNKLVSLLCFNV